MLLKSLQNLKSEVGIPQHYKSASDQLETRDAVHDYLELDPVFVKYPKHHSDSHAGS